MFCFFIFFFGRGGGGGGGGGGEDANCVHRRATIDKIRVSTSLEK